MTRLDAPSNRQLASILGKLAARTLRERRNSGFSEAELAVAAELDAAVASR